MILRPFFFTDVRQSNNITSFTGTFTNARQSFEARVAHVSNFPDSIRVQPGCVILPYEDRYYVVEVHVYSHPRVTREPLSPIAYSEYIPPFVYQVMCGLIATIL